MLIPGGIVIEEQDEDSAYETKRQREVDAEAEIVDAAFRDILQGDFDSAAVSAVMGRRAGSIQDYVRMKDEYDAAVRAVRHSRSA